MANDSEERVIDSLMTALRGINVAAGYLVDLAPGAVVFGSRVESSPSQGPTLFLAPRQAVEEFQPSTQRDVARSYEIVIECGGVDALDAYKRCSRLKRCVNRALIVANSHGGYAYQTDAQVTWTDLELHSVGRWAMMRTIDVKWRESGNEV